MRRQNLIASVLYLTITTACGSGRITLKDLPDPIDERLLEPCPISKPTYDALIDAGVYHNEIQVCASRHWALVQSVKQR